MFKAHLFVAIDIPANFSEDIFISRYKGLYKHVTKIQTCIYYYYYYVFILSAISPYSTGLKALFNQSDCTGTAPTVRPHARKAFYNLPNSTTFALRVILTDTVVNLLL